MSSRIPSSLDRRVRERAGERCEYCHLAQAGQEATFHIDHIVPLHLDGPTTMENLALACVSCSLRKGARREAVDPDTGQSVELFDPRALDWSSHFRVTEHSHIVGLTATGRATVAALQMNRPLAVAIRRAEVALRLSPLE